MKTFFTLLMVVVMSARAQFNFTDIAFMAAGGPPCTSYTIGDVTGFTATEIADGGGGYYEGANYYEFVAYAYRTVNGVKIYSATGEGGYFYDEDAGDNFYIQLSWNAVANADGYRIHVLDDYDYGVNVGAPSVYFDVPGATSVTIGDGVSAGYVGSPVNSSYLPGLVTVTPTSTCQ